ncbi:hypothetical protein SAMN04487935_2434 [Flavobacterium noncentrifugens]|uniref:Uncharacterized protein n=1 Tax=Flavobacterium noncentrifugens TaxID=1128970 RepID=A0A1G8YQA8_9FLAO|nr:hypothetical protein SAMN04487935_2434 [Flavobacterium noncentrifugens]
MNQVLILLIGFLLSLPDANTRCCLKKYNVFVRNERKNAIFKPSNQNNFENQSFTSNEFLSAKKQTTTYEKKNYPTDHFIGGCSD